MDNHGEAIKKVKKPRLGENEDRTFNSEELTNWDSTIVYIVSDKHLLEYRIATTYLSLRTQLCSSISSEDKQD